MTEGWVLVQQPPVLVQVGRIRRFRCKAGQGSR
jgi:hypothetical protein